MKKLLILGLVGILTSNGYVFSIEDMTNQKNASKPVHIPHNPQQDLFDKNIEELKIFLCDLLLNNNAIYEELFEYYNSGYSKEDIVSKLRSYCAASLSDPKQSKLRDLLFVTNTEVEEAVDKILYNTFINDIVYADDTKLFRFARDTVLKYEYDKTKYELWENDKKKLASFLREMCLQEPELSNNPRVEKLLLNEKKATKAAVDETLLRGFLYAVGW